MSKKRIRCTTPNCRASRHPENMFVAEAKVRRRSNGGKMVGSERLKDFAVCQACAHRLRRQGKVRFMPFLEEMKWERHADFDRNISEEIEWAASQF